MNPSFVVADEPTSMLDVSIRISIMRLMTEFADELGVTYLYITHDLAVARYMCDRIAVMYLGKIVELAPTEELLRNPMHPYTRALLSAVPVPDPSYHRPPSRSSAASARRSTSRRYAGSSNVARSLPTCVETETIHPSTTAVMSIS